MRVIVVLGLLLTAPFAYGNKRLLQTLGFPPNLRTDKNFGATANKLSDVTLEHLALLKGKMCPQPKVHHPFVTQVINKIGYDNLKRYYPNPDWSYHNLAHATGLANMRARYGLPRITKEDKLEGFEARKFITAQILGMLFHDATDTPGFPYPHQSIAVVNRLWPYLESLFDLGPDEHTLVNANIWGTDFIAPSVEMRDLLETFAKLPPQYQKWFPKTNKATRLFDATERYAKEGPVGVMRALTGLNYEMNNIGLQLPGSIDENGLTDVIPETINFVRSLFMSPMHPSMVKISEMAGVEKHRLTKDWFAILNSLGGYYGDNLNFNLDWLYGVNQKVPIHEAIRQAEGRMEHHNLIRENAP